MAGIQGAPSPKPGSVASPVPNQKSAVEDFFAESAPNSAPSLPPGEDQYAPVSVETPPQETPGIGSRALETAGQVLDYAGGLTRTGLAGAAGAAAARPEQGHPQAHRGGHRAGWLAVPGE